MRRMKTKKTKMKEERSEAQYPSISIYAGALPHLNLSPFQATSSTQPWVGYPRSPRG